MDAITMLKDDHRSVEKLFSRFEDAGPRAFVEKRKIVDRIIEELSVHAAVEEQLFYPVTRATVPAVEDVALESLEEHHVVKWMLSELDGMDAEDERFVAKATVLIENVRHHVKEEEDEYFPEVRSELGPKALGELGDAMATLRETVPTHPHPRMPDTPPGNTIPGMAVGAVDRLVDTAGGVARTGVASAQDLVDRVRGKPRRQRTSGRASTRPRGLRRTARAMRTLRPRGDDTLERVIARVREANEAKEAGTQAAGAAGSGGSRAAKTAKTAKEPTKS
jgi:hemerythrin-like domain-containing protein